MDIIKFERKLYNSQGDKSKPIESKNFLIYQIGDLTYLQGGTIPKHTQMFDFEFSFAEQGNAVFYTNEKSHPLSVGDVHITLKNDTHEIVASGFFQFSYFAIDIKKSSKIYSLCQELMEACKNLDFKVLRFPQYFPIISHILNENVAPDKYSKIVLDNCISQFLIYLYRCLITPTQYATKNNFFYSLILDIDKNCMMYTSVKSIAKKYNYTEIALCKMFKKQTGKTLKSYLVAKRLNYAKKLLMQEKSVSEVSEILHYSSPYNFSRAYKNHFNVSPKKDQKSKK